MIIQEVNSKATIQEFLDVPKILYKNDPNYTCLLDVEIEDIFNPKSNDCFKYGEAKRWVLKDDSHHLIGRIAAFYDNRKKDHSYITSGNIGFFECTNNQEAANLLFNTSKMWLESNGIKAMDGSTNFGENLFHWGVLVQGFEPQSIGMPYNYPYYKDLFENYGFKTYFQQYSYTRDLAEPWPERQYKFAEFLASRPGFKYEHFRFEEKDRFINDLVSTYNEIWSDFHEEYTPLKREDIVKMFNEIKDIIDPELIWFCYAENRCIGMVVSLPDINPILRKIGNGKLNLINKLKLAYYLKINKSLIKSSRTIMSGVVPEYQQKGQIAVLFLHLIKVVTAKKHNTLEMSWTGDYNEPVLKVYESVGAKHTKTHITYRFIFDSSIEFKRFTNEGGYKTRKEKKKQE